MDINLDQQNISKYELKHVGARDLIWMVSPNEFPAEGDETEIPFPCPSHVPSFSDIGSAG